MRPKKAPPPSSDGGRDDNSTTSSIVLRRPHIPTPSANGLVGEADRAPTARQDARVIEDSRRTQIAFQSLREGRGFIFVLTTMQTALILPTKWSAPPSVNIPRRANELKRAKQPSGTANASNTRRFMVTSPATPPVPNPTTAHQLNNAVQKICSVSAFGAHAPASGRPRAAKCLPVTLRRPTTSNSGQFRSVPRT